MRRGAGAILLLAAALRMLRGAVRWEEWSLHYAAYNLPTLESLLAGNVIEAAQLWVGLHPPLYPLLHSVLSSVWPAPIAWIALSVAASTGAVLFMIHAEEKTLLPAFLVATDPVQLHYAAEVSNYPLGVLIASYAWWAYRTKRPIHLTASIVLGFWTHLLAGAFALLTALWEKNRVKTCGIAALFIAPLAASAFGLGIDPGSRKQPDLFLEASIADAIERFGIGWVMCIPLLLLGVSKAKEAAATWGTMVFLWGSLVLLGFAAPHQFPYAVFLAIPASVLLSAASERGPALKSIIWIAALTRGLWWFAGDSARAVNIWSDLQRYRAVDEIWNVSLPGDAIVLVRGPGVDDDDKRHFSPVLWRFRPWERMEPIFTTIRPDIVGQPRLLRGRRIYTFNHPMPAIGNIPGEHVFTVLYDGAEHNRTSIPHHPRQGDWVEAGNDLWRGPMLSGSAEDAAQEVEASDESPPGPQRAH